MRDEICREGAKLFTSAATKKESEEIIIKNLPLFKEIANRVLKDNGFRPGADAECKVLYFPTKTYEGIRLPCGSYKSLVITLGSGKGENWWCVMYPPLCFSPAKNDALKILENNLNKNSYNTITKNDAPYALSFKLMEIFAEKN